MLRTIIVDDEPLARERLKRFLRDESDVEIVAECGNGNDAIEKIKELRPDLVFLDIQMPEKNGFDVIRALGPKLIPTVIFVTAYDQYALKAFDVHALDYLLKPSTKERVHRAVGRARDHLSNGPKDSIDDRLIALIEDLKQEKRYLDRLVVKSNGRVFFLKADEIDWIEAAGNYVKLHTGRDAHMIRETMNGIEGKLDPKKFIRIHRSTVVNIDRIKELHPMFSGDYAVILRDNTELSLSRNYRDRFQGFFENQA